VRWDSPLVLAAAGTLAVHILLVVIADAIVVTHPLHPDPPPPKVELFDIELPPPPPPPPPEAPVAQTMAVAPLPAPAPRAHVAHVATSPRSAPEPTPAPASPPTPDPGGVPTLHEENLGPPGTGPLVSRGRPNAGPVGHGGTGTGTGSGAGAGSGSGEVPISVAAIKTRALPRGDFSYYDLGKDYPVEAKQLGIEGDILVRLVVDDRGKVVSRKLLTHLGHGLDELAYARAGQIEFTPARDSADHPVASVVVWTFHMTLPK
jgi:protein TonB